MFLFAGSVCLSLRFLVVLLACIKREGSVKINRVTVGFNGRKLESTQWPWFRFGYKSQLVDALCLISLCVSVCCVYIKLSTCLCVCASVSVCVCFWFWKHILYRCIYNSHKCMTNNGKWNVKSNMYRIYGCVCWDGYV